MTELHSKYQQALAFIESLGVSAPDLLAYKIMTDGVKETEPGESVRDSLEAYFEEGSLGDVFDGVEGVALELAREHDESKGE